MKAWLLRLDDAAWMRPSMRWFGRRIYTFQACGAIGVLLATALAMGLIAGTGLAPWVALVLLASGALTFVGLALLTKALTGRESLIYYHHEIAVLAVSAAVLSLLHAPVLRYLDVTALWLGVFLACGRVGCLAVGCCHGKPHHWGVRYTDEHAEAGFAPCYVGVRLFPVQLLEAFIVLLIVAVCAVFVALGRPAGTALSTYIVVYSAVRIWLEEMRGDAARPYWGHFSEAQWTSLALLAALMLSEWSGRLPAERWHAVLAGFSALSMLALRLFSRARREVLHPSHAGEVAIILRTRPFAGVGPLPVRLTSLSIGISTERVVEKGGPPVTLYSLSRHGRRLKMAEVRALARLMVKVGTPGGRGEIVDTYRGVFHVIVREARS